MIVVVGVGVKVSIEVVAVGVGENNMIFKIEHIGSWSWTRRKWKRSWSGIRIIRYRCDRSWSVSCRWDIKRSISLSRSVKYDF